MFSFDTIVAPVTPSGEGGVGIVRLSGPDSAKHLNKAFQGKTKVDVMQSHRLYHGYLVDNEGVRVDEVLAVVMRAPHSYTGDEVVEVHCHGGSQVMRNVLDLFLLLGARMAAPGEFTQRAFLNGRLDLAQAEAVIDVIKARSDKASRVALDQLDGSLSRKVHAFSDQLREALALIEAHIDFPDDEVGELNLPKLLAPVKSLSAEISNLIGSFDVGRVLRDGISLLILGRPNVGKSSLMNALLGEKRAIVTDVAGTTRDTLEETIVFSGVPVRIIDSAGVRHTTDIVELEGVNRAKEKIKTADILLVVVDGSSPVTEEDLLVFGLCDPDRTLLVVNKSDKEQVCDFDGLALGFRKVSVSAKHNTGLDLLRDQVVKCLGVDNVSSVGEGVVVSERRHRDALLKATVSLQDLFVSIDACAPLECLAMDLRDALSSLGQITGETTPDEILDQIFSKFCIGK